MELTLNKSDLNRAIAVTQSVVEKKATMPILVNVLLSAADGYLKLSSTDLEITTFVNVKANVKSSGSTTVNAKVLAELVRELPEGELLFKLTDGERLEITAGKSKFKIVGVSAEEFPALPGIGADVKGRISSHQLNEMITKTLYAVSQDETRFNLNGVCFELIKEGKEELLRLVATDGHRLAMITRRVDNLSFPDRIIVPKKGLAEIKKLIDPEHDKVIGIDIKDGFFLVETDEAKISMRLVDGEFPDYHQVLPKKKGVLATAQSGDLAQALKRVALMVTDKGKGVRLDYSKNDLRISSSSPELGEAREQLEIEYVGEQLSVGFNAKYLVDIALSLQEDQPLVMELNGELGPGKFFSASDDSYVCVVMPMRLN